MNDSARVVASVLLVAGLAGSASAAEPGCPESGNPDPAVVFCEDFDSGAALRDRFAEYSAEGASFEQAADVGLGGSHGMRVTWQAGQVSAGWLIRTFGRTPPGFYASQSHGDRDFREIYWREYLRTQSGWTGEPAKVSRVYSIANGNWAQAMIAHLWSGRDLALALDPASGIDKDGRLITTTYNDFAHLRWLGGPNAIDAGWSGSKWGKTPIYATDNSNRWFCIETHVKLNDPGRSNGVLEFWIDGNLEARLEGLNWVGAWQEYGINALSIENYWNDGAPARRERYRDNFVVATRRIGCLSTTGGGSVLGPPGRPELVQP